MVAMLILLVCIAPAMRIFTNIFRSQQEIIRENQKDHLAHLVHMRTTEKLYKREISLDDIKEKKEILSLADEDIRKFNESNFLEFNGFLSIESTHKTKIDGKMKPITYLCKLEITVTDKSVKQEKKDSFNIPKSASDTYAYYIFIDTRKEDESDDEDEQKEETINSEDELEEDFDEEDVDFDDDEDDDSPFQFKHPVENRAKATEPKVAQGEKK